MTPAATSSTSENGRPCRRDTAARMASITGCRSARPAPAARSATMTTRSPASSAGGAPPPVAAPPARARRPFGNDDHTLAGLIGGRSPPPVRPHRERRDVTRSHCRRRLGRGGLDILRIVVAAIDDNQILDTPGDVELTVEVDAEITGPQPGGLARCPVRMAAYRQCALQLVAEHPLGFLGACPVATADIVAMQPDLADLPVGEFRLGVGVDDDAPLAAGDPAAGNLRDGVGRVRRDPNRTPDA